jgi:hypothetical protein
VPFARIFWLAAGKLPYLLILYFSLLRPHESGVSLSLSVVRLRINDEAMNGKQGIRCVFRLADRD